MATDTNIRIEGLDKLLKKLGKLGPPVYAPAIAESATHIKSVIATYPPRVLGRKQPPKTLRQRIFLINAIEEGLIEVPYRRGLSPGSEAMGRRWTIVFRDRGKTAIVGNNASYVSLVQGHGTQSPFHEEGGWKTDRQVADQESREVKEILARHIAVWARSK
jgi:hypothetical protein